MKKLFTVAISIILLSLMTSLNVFSQSGAAINTTGAAADPSAMLDVSSLNRGVLIPRITMAQRALIASPATGLMIYQTDNDTGFYYNAGLSASPVWLQLMPNPANTDLDMNSNKITNLATCTQNYDAANKEYVDAVSAGGGSGSPTMLSDRSASSYNLAGAVNYCRNLNESGYSDWHLPKIDDLMYLLSLGGATVTNPGTGGRLWTSSWTMTTYPTGAQGYGWVSPMVYDESTGARSVKVFRSYDASWGPFTETSTFEVRCAR